jgi:hypothetical protein
MKKIKLLLFILVFTGGNCMVKAQIPYRAGIGGMYLPAIPAMGVGGVSFKTFLTEHAAFQTDIYLKMMLTGDIKHGVAIYTSYVSNTNIMYQKTLKEYTNCNLFWIMGGGVSLGFTFIGNAKFGANAIMGLEYVFLKKRFAIQMDLRPGYGILFSSYSRLNGVAIPDKNPWSHFDWYMGVTFRYTFTH